MLKTPTGTNWEFEGFKVMTDMRLLIADGRPVPLTSKAFDTLVVLIENRDRVVTKDELLQAVWPDVEVEEGNLTQQIFLLRKALGESAQEQRVIVTIPGHGYRFTARATPIANEVATSQGAADGAQQSSRSPGGSRFTGGPLAAIAVVVLVALVSGYRWIAVDSKPLPLDLTTARITKITESGNATNSALSSDGRYVAYIENDGDEYSVWVQQTAAGGRAQVVPRQPQVLSHLAFGADGEYIYFARGAARRGGFRLHRVPAIGGPETPVLDDVDSPVTFSPDGRQFAFMRGAGSETHVVIAATGGGAQRILATRTSPRAFLFVAPDWSPDGTMIAASATDQSSGWRSSIVVLPVDGGNAHELYRSDSRIGRARWLPDGSGLLVVVSEALTRQFALWQPGTFLHISGGSIWRVAYPDGRAEQLTSDLIDHDICCLDVGANGRMVASVTNSLVSDLWITPVDHLDAPRQITSGNPVVSRHSWLTDNDTIVYRDLNGRLNGVHKDGRAFSLSLPDGHKAAGGVSACGDGRNVVFQAVPGNSIWRVSANAGGPIKLTRGIVDTNPACSPDGKWVLYSTMTTDRPSLWRVGIEGGEPTVLVKAEGFDALPSPSGRLIYYSTFELEDGPDPLRVLRWIVVSTRDHQRQFVLDSPKGATLGLLPAWAPDESGLDYVVNSSGVSNIWRQPLAGGPPVQITQFTTGKIFSFAWSPNGRWLSLAKGINRSDVVLMSIEP